MDFAFSLINISAHNMKESLKANRKKIICEALCQGWQVREEGNRENTRRGVIGDGA